MSPEASSAARAAEAFAEQYGCAPAGVWAAPGRVNLVGEHTDYNDGLVLPFALPHTARAAAAPREDRRVRITSLMEPGVVEVSLDDLAGEGESPRASGAAAVAGWAAYPAGMLWALLRDGERLTGMDILLDSDVPLGAGLSSSAALECSVGLAAAELAGLSIAPLELARLAQRAENDYVGMPCGIMDQTASVAGRAGHALMLDTRTLEVEQVPLDLAAAGMTLMVIDSQAPHRLVDGEYAARRRQCEEGARSLGISSLRLLNDQGTTPEELDVSVDDDVVRRRVRHVLTENERVLEARELLRQGTAEALGEILNASHASQQQDFEITVPETDGLVDAVRTAGALGARQVGGGFGGCVIALVPDAALEAVTAAVHADASSRGLEEPLIVRAEPSAGARRLA